MANLNTTGRYAAYLRKSRKDLEAEAHGEGETLARHEHILNNLAVKMGVHISRFYREIVSGETIASRPVMQSLLSDVENECWNGIFVVEIERLARGDTIDQGIVSQTFKYSNTTIITPMKIYNPNDQYDEEYFEFGLFMSRREYKTINRRIQAGRIESIKEGKYPANRPPLGYDIYKLPNEKGFSLKINPKEAPAIKYIFEKYVYEKMGTSTIAHNLNSMGYRTKQGNEFISNTVIFIIENPVFCGYVSWGKRKAVKKMKDGQIIKSRPENKDYLMCKGRHEPIVSEELWKQAKEMHDRKAISIPRKSTELANPLCGLVNCARCGRKMNRKPDKEYPERTQLYCQNPKCSVPGSKINLVEERIINTISSWMDDYEIEAKGFAGNLDGTIGSLRANIEELNKELELLNVQLNNAYDFLEQGIYSLDIFQQRKDSIQKKMDSINQKVDNIKIKIDKLEKDQDNMQNFIPKIQNIVKCYWNLTSAKAKNDLLKEVIDHVDYSKTKKGRNHMDEFELMIYPITK